MVMISESDLSVVVVISVFIELHATQVNMYKIKHHGGAGR